ncbi:hypothetical protein FM114_13720 [Luteococcus japonicus LSP_Lj1]|uniref:Uncharacterized protein n=1 Tax=Luteococcus japonicus LSP_Lj1 TaxID=1255658 RepID=A0A1R4KEN7_9ACTN|nr:hypothetical protein FM114_13720 [Luteococcus japonicus LSP_Lj1]
MPGSLYAEHAAGILRASVVRVDLVGQQSIGAKWHGVTLSRVD